MSEQTSSPDYSAGARYVLQTMLQVIHRLDPEADCDEECRPSSAYRAPKVVDLLAHELARHALARPEGEHRSWCVCLRWSQDRGSLLSDIHAYERHVAEAQMRRITAPPAPITDPRADTVRGEVASEENAHG